MEFFDVWSLFNYHIDHILDSAELEGTEIGEVQIKYLSKILQKFTTVPVSQKNIREFIDSVVKYFIVLIKYWQQLKNPSYKHFLIIRMALDMFLFVVDCTNIYELVTKKFGKVIYTMLENYSNLSCIKEFLKLYRVLLNKAPGKIIKKIKIKHHHLQILYNIVKQTSDVDIQAIVIEIVLKFVNLNLPHSPLEQIFPEICEVSLLEGTNIYIKIRMVLDELNRESSSIFSINCNEITLDQITVTEFDDANFVHDTWLDIDLSDKKLSFFCSKSFLSSFTLPKFKMPINWEVLSFQVKDILNTKFAYNSATENMEIEIKIKASALNLFANIKFDTVRCVIISISKYSSKYEELVNSVLPKLFGSSFPSYSFKIDDKKSSDVTPDLIQSNKDSPSPVIEYVDLSEKKKKVSVRNRTVSSYAEQELMTEDGDEEQVKNRRKVSVYSDRGGSNELSKSVKKSKISTSERLTEKSITPLSFIESMKVGCKIIKSKVSILKENKTIIDTINAKKNMKISALKGKRKRKSKIPAVQSKNEEISKHQEKEESPIVSLNQDQLEFSSSKVENWLKTIDSKDSSQNQVLQEKSSNELAVNELEGIKKWMKEDWKEISEEIQNQKPNTVPSSSQKSTGRTESLLELLGKDLEERIVNDGKNAENKNEEKEMDGQILQDKKIMKNKTNKTPSEQLSITSLAESDIPLAQLAAKLKKTEKKEAVISSQVDETLQRSILADVRVVEFGEISEDSFIVEKNKEKETKKLLYPIEAETSILKDSNSKTTEKEQEKSAKTLNVAQVSIDENQDNKNKKAKRSLYDPNDLSYLDATITDDYIKSKSDENKLANTSKQEISVNKSSTKVYQRRSYRTRNSKSKSMCDLITCAKSDISMKTSLTFDRAFSSLKQKIKEQKRMSKLNQKTAQRKNKKGQLTEVSSPSTPSSLEPFGVGIRKLTNKRKEASQPELKSKRLKSQEGEDNKKINIISNIVVQPASAKTRKRQKSKLAQDAEPVNETSKPCFCSTFIEDMNRTYLQFISHVAECNPLNLTKEGFVKVANVLNQGNQNIK